MVQRRTQDPTLRPTAAADGPTVRVTFEYLACATLSSKCFLSLETARSHISRLTKMRQGRTSRSCQ